MPRPFTNFEQPAFLGEVRRVTTGDERHWSSHVEPALDPRWTPLDKLRWHAAVVSLDCGLEVTVMEHPNNWQINVRNPRNGRHTNMAISEYSSCWDYMTGVGVGALVERSLP